ncbi:MAG: class I SAM-dependent methyltransferase [Patescibacteria group bacterium]
MFDGSNKNLNYKFWDDFLLPKYFRKREMKVFEVGAGGGRNMRYLFNRLGDKVRIYGSDISKKAIDYANSLDIGEFYVSEAHKFPIQDKYDLIVIVDVLEHLQTLGDVKATVNNAIEHLKPNGFLYLSIPTELNKFCLTWVFSKLPYFRNLSRRFFGHTIQFDKKMVKDLVNVEGLTTLEVFYSAHLLTQIQMAFFYYIPKILLSIAGNDILQDMRDSQDVLGQSLSPLSFLKRFVVSISRPLASAAYVESVLRRKSGLAAGNIHLLLRKNETYGKA